MYNNFTSPSPITQAYFSAAAFAKSPTYHSQTLTRAEYAEGGSNAARRKFRDWKSFDSKLFKASLDSAADSISTSNFVHSEFDHPEKHSETTRAKGKGTGKQKEDTTSRARKPRVASKPSASLLSGNSVGRTRSRGNASGSGR